MSNRRRQTELSLLTIALLALVMTAACPGCISSSILPSEDELSHLRLIVVRAVEPPPLVAPLASIHDRMQPWTLFGSPGFVVAGIAVVTETATHPPDAITHELNYKAYLKENGAWNPTAVLADSVVSLLRPPGPTRVTRDSAMLEIPGLEDRTPTFSMENWYAPIRAWYNAEPQSAPARDPPPAATHATLAVGILNYEIYEEQLVLQVLVKLEETATGRVVGRTRRDAAVPVGDLETLFAGDGKRFKEIFGSTGTRLLREALQALRLPVRIEL